MMKSCEKGIRSSCRGTNLRNLRVKFPLRRQQSPAAISRHRHFRLVEFLPIPQLARDLPVRLVQRFTVICVSAATDFFTATESYLSKPVRIGQRLARHADDVRVVVSQNRLRLVRKL